MYTETGGALSVSTSAVTDSDVTSKGDTVKEKHIPAVEEKTKQG